MDLARSRWPALGKQPDNVYTIDLLAPISGTVVTKKAFKGQYIKTGEPLFEMGNLSRLWFHAEVYERDLPDIRIGQKAILDNTDGAGSRIRRDGYLHRSEFRSEDA